MSLQQVHASNQGDAIQILKKTSEELNSLKEIQYTYFRSINYLSENYHAENTFTTFLDFTKAAKTLDFVFQIEDENSKVIYNGDESFTLNIPNKTISIKNNPAANSFENSSFLYNSIPTLKSALPKLIDNPEIQIQLTDTTIQDQQYHLISITLKSKILSGLGNFSTLSSDRDIIYKISIDQNSFLPFEVIQTNNITPQDFTLTRFTNIETNAVAPSELSWFYSTYHDYTKKTDKPLTILSENTIAPNFTLPYFDGPQSFSLEQAKSEFILLEFWIKNCGYCIQAVSKLNKLAGQFDSKTLEIIGINGTDSKEDIQAFHQRNGVLYKTLYDQGATTTQTYGVDAFPQVVLLNKERKIIYSGDLDIEKIEKSLKF